MFVCSRVWGGGVRCLSVFGSVRVVVCSATTHRQLGRGWGHSSGYTTTGVAAHLAAPSSVGSGSSSSLPPPTDSLLSDAEQFMKPSMISQSSKLEEVEQQN